MDFDFMSIMDKQCNNDNYKIADACVHKIYSFECYLYRTFCLELFCIGSYDGYPV